MSTRTATQARTTPRPYDLLVDTDVHPIMREGIGCALPYMPAAWRERFEALPPMPPPSGVGRPFPFGEYTLTVDAVPPEGGPPGSSPQFMVTDFLDRYDVGVAHLMQLEGLVATGACPDPEMAAVLNSALNDYLMERWLIDPRLRLAMLVSSADPVRAAEEIRRIGGHPGICSVMLQPIPGKPLGVSHYHPIYEAAVEQSLPITTHGAGPPAVGSQTYVEDRVNVAIGGWVQTNSLVMQGTFERFPTLKVLIVECGFSWIVPLMWRMDAGWRRNRYEVPWLKRWPSEYVRDHIRLTTQPVDDDPDPTELYHQIESEKLGLLDVLTYSSDYPHWDNDRPGAVFNRLSDATKRRLFCENGKATLRLT
jgi:hypothetical protein